MNKSVLITGSTDGIGLATAKTLIQMGHKVLLHGRSEEKLAAVKEQLTQYSHPSKIETYIADLSRMAEATGLAKAITQNHNHLDVLINNAGVYSVTETVTADGLDVRFMVNTIAPYLLTKLLLSSLGSAGRVVNLSSAAQSPINPTDLSGPSALDDGIVYAQSKLALTMWSRSLAESLGSKNTAIIAINPASLLGSKMVKQAYGVAGGDLQIGADVLVRAALSEEFSDASGLYFDNDIGRFTNPHEDAFNTDKIEEITEVLDEIISKAN